ncbi:MAG: peptidylprolyl isomerase [Gemmatimonadota bacterium]
MRPTLLLLAVLAAPAAAQSAPLTPPDSALLYRILTAEDHRDRNDSALVEGGRHPDARIRSLATRALARITDSTYAARRDGPSYAPRAAWPLPEWRPRYDSLRTKRHDCTALEHAMQDGVVQVRLRAIDLLSLMCADSGTIISRLPAWVDALEDRSLSALAPPVRWSWHTAAHALVALARLRPGLAGARVVRLSTHRQWEVRMYAARAAVELKDTTLLRQLARDRDDNVREAAIDGLAQLAGHAEDSVYLQALNSSGAQAVRAAAIALKGTAYPDAPRLLDRALRRWLRRPNDSERDVRLALLTAAGRPATDDRPFSGPAPLPAEVVALALGADIRLRVTMAAANGGGVFIVGLRGDVAPITAARIVALAERGYYDGLRWHRVIPDFVTQGGGPGANEYVGYPRFFRDELGTIPHLRGGVGMSTRGHDTGDAQWFFDLSDNARLDKDYTLFGVVVEGMDVVDRILEGDVIGTIRLERH